MAKKQTELKEAWPLPDERSKEAAQALTPSEQKIQLEAELTDLDASMRALQAKRAALVEQIDELTVAIEGVKSPHENQLEIQKVIERSTEVRANRVQRLNEIVALGVNPSELAPIHVSPLDAAIASKNRNKFPHRPLAGKVVQ
jgi:chromosome segregation ATPase